MTQTGAAQRPAMEDLVRSLAGEAGRAKARGPSLDVAFPAAAIAAVPLSLTVVLLVTGARPDFLSIAGSWIFLFKVTAMLLMASGGLLLVRAASIPGAAPKPLFALAPAAAFLIVNALADRSGLSLLGVRPPYSAFLCVSVIVLASLPALVLLLSVMRRGIPTRLRQAGFFAGLLAGALGALAYTVACVNDGAAFVALWYVAAALIMAGIGAAAGPRALAW